MPYEACVGERAQHMRSNIIITRPHTIILHILHVLLYIQHGHTHTLSYSYLIYPPGYVFRDPLWPPVFPKSMTFFVWVSFCFLKLNSASREMWSDG